MKFKPERVYVKPDEEIELADGDRVVSVADDEGLAGLYVYVLRFVP